MIIDYATNLYGGTLWWPGVRESQCAWWQYQTHWWKHQSINQSINLSTPLKVNFEQMILREGINKSIFYQRGGGGDPPPAKKVNLKKKCKNTQHALKNHFSVLSPLFKINNNNKKTLSFYVFYRGWGREEGQSLREMSPKKSMPSLSELKSFLCKLFMYIS